MALGGLGTCRRRRRAAAHRWTGHHGVRGGEWATDRLRNGAGSWTFVFALLVFLGVWMALNRPTGLDPIPRVRSLLSASSNRGGSA